MAAFDFQSSPGRDLFVRLTRMLIAGGTPVLRDILRQHHTPASLATALQGTRIGFNKSQKLLVKPPSGLPDFDQFDISLLFKLLRNCCGLTEPATKWNGLPVDGDHSLEADIVRIDYYRNEIYGHALEHMALTQDDFNQYWRVISDTLCRIANHLPRMDYVTELRNKVAELRYSRLTADDHRMFEDALRIESMLVEQYRKLENIEAKEDQLREGIEGLQDTMINALQRTNISDDKTSTAAVPSTVNYTNITLYNQCGPFNEQAQRPQPGAQGIRRQVSDGTISHPSPQRSYKKSTSLPNHVSLTTPFAGESFGIPGTPAISYFQSPQTPGETLWQSSALIPATTIAQPKGQDYAPFYIGHDQSPARPSLEPLQDHRADQVPSGNHVPRHHGTPNPAATAPRGEARMFGQEGLPLADQVAAPWNLHYHTTGSVRGASQVSPPVSSEYHVGQDPLLRIKISISGVRLSGFCLSEFVQSALDAYNEGTDALQFASYLEKQQLAIEKIEGNLKGDFCSIGVRPRDLKSLEALWHDFIHQDLTIFVKETVFPEDFEGEVVVDIDGEEYKKCCERLRPKGFADSTRPLHSQSFSELGVSYDDASQPFPGNISRARSHSVMDLSRPAIDASQELFRLLCRNGGRMDWQMAINQLPYYRSEYAKPAFRRSMQKYNLEFLANNVVRAKVSLRFCPKMRKDRTCSDTNCQDLHLCRFHFLPEGCQFHTKCKNSHDISDHHTNNVFRMANLSFLNNEEREQLLGNVAYVAPEICFYYNKDLHRNACREGGRCPCLHVCRDWVLGRPCIVGNACRRAHTFNNLHEQNILKKKNLDQLPETEILENLKKYCS